MNILMFLAALAVITLGHFFRIRRWKSFISVYEDSHDSDLMFCTGIGYLVDNVLPFHVGDIVRAAIIGKKLKNGVAFSLAVIIIDRILDVFVVPKNKPCKRNNRQISDNTKIAAKQGNAEERPDAGCEIKRWKAAAEMSSVFNIPPDISKADKPQGFGDRVPDSR